MTTTIITWIIAIFVVCMILFCCNKFLPLVTAKPTLTGKGKAYNLLKINPKSDMTPDQVRDLVRMLHFGQDCRTFADVDCPIPDSISEHVDIIGQTDDIAVAGNYNFGVYTPTSTPIDPITTVTGRQ